MVMGLLESLLGEQIGDVCDFQGMANQRLGNGFEPIDWPEILSNQFRALALTRPLTVLEQFAYDGALRALNQQNKP